MCIKELLITSWHIFRGRSLVGKNGPRVAVCGGRFAKPGSAEYVLAYALGRALAQRNIGVLTGGGPGVMQAVGCGVFDQTDGKMKALGINVYGVDQDFVREPSDYVYFVGNFFIRDGLLLSHARAFVMFPGGYGTVAELFQVLNLMCLKQIPRAPVILVDQAFWQPLLDWLAHEPDQRELLWTSVSDLVRVCTSVEEILDFLAL